MENNLVKIQKKLKLSMSDLKLLYIVIEAMEKSGKMTIEDFRTLITVLPHMTTVLTETLDLPMHEAWGFVKRGKFKTDMLDELFCELEVKLGIYESPVCRRQVD